MDGHRGTPFILMHDGREPEPNVASAPGRADVDRAPTDVVGAGRDPREWARTSGLAFVDVVLGREPSVVAHIEGRGLGLPKYDGADDWRAALAWAQERTPRVVFHAGGITYWAGAADLRPDDLPQLPQEPTVRLDAALREAGRVRDSLRSAIEAIRRLQSRTTQG